MNAYPTPAPADAPSGSFILRKLLLALFLHKWKILICTAIGVGAALFVFFTHPRVYESQAKLLVRYVVERSSDPKADSVGYYKDNIVSTEMEILTSWDLAVKVADAITPKRLLPEAVKGATTAEAANAILKATTITASRGSNVMMVSYRNRDPELSGLVLQELVSQYFEKHLDVHRSAGMFDLVSQQTDQVRSRLTQTEDELKRLKRQAGIVSLEGNAASLESQLIKSTGDLQSATAERLSQDAFVQELQQQQTDGVKKALAEETSAVSSDDVERYRELIESQELLRKKQLELESKFTSDSRVVQLNREQLANLESQRLALAKSSPGVLATVRAGDSTRTGVLDIMAERARLAGAEAKEKALTENLDRVKKQVEAFSQVETQIAQLERKKEMEEKNYMYFESSLEKARVDEALDPTKMPNISVVQKPSPPMRIIGEVRKVVIGLSAGGLVTGLVLALLCGMVLDGSIKRPYEIEEVLRLPLLMAIPDFGQRKRITFGRPRRSQKASEEALVSPKDRVPTEFRPFAEAIRDRLLLYFELAQMQHRPKLVGITGCESGVGVSTLASGLAASLSATGVGRILLVNMDCEEEKIRGFFEGRTHRSLTQVIRNTATDAAGTGNLELACAGSAEGHVAQVLPSQFYELVPSLRASGFAYIIFDMPPLDEGSVTLALAGSMDKTVLVVEAGRSQAHLVRRAYRELTAARAKVSGVLNKTRTYGPAWMAAHS